MKKIYLGLIIFLVATVLYACGKNGGGGDGDAASITLLASKSVALADGVDAVTVRAEVKNSDGAAAADGTIVTFTVPADSGAASTTTAPTANGIASFALTRNPITGANNKTVVVTGVVGGASSTAEVKFINQPAGAEVSISFDQAVTNLAGLQFTLNSSAGATFDNATQPIIAINNAAAGSQTIIAANFTPASSSTTVGLANASLSGINTGTTPIIKTTFAVSAGLPLFSIDLASAATFTATDPDGGPVAPAVTATNLVVTVKYDTE